MEYVYGKARSIVMKKRFTKDGMPIEWLSSTRGRVNGILLSDVEREEVKWLWAGRIPAGKITVLDGDPGLGKSVFTTDLAARVSTGRTFPDSAPCELGGVVLMNAEDGLADTIRPRVDAVGGDPSRILALAEVPDEEDPTLSRTLSIPADLDIIESGIERVGAKLVIIDPLMAFLTSATDSHKDQDIRRVLASLKFLAERTGVAIVLVRHLNKSSGGNPLYRGGGSIGIIGAARMGLMIAQDPEIPERRILATTKQNLSNTQSSIVFTVETAGPGPGEGTARIEYVGESELSASDLLKPHLDEEAGYALREAQDFLKETLGTASIWSKTVINSAREAGISHRTLKRAKSELSIKSVKEADGSWSWSMPNADI